jgi:hypothetical protein
MKKLFIIMATIAMSCQPDKPVSPHGVDVVGKPIFKTFKEADSYFHALANHDIINTCYECVINGCDWLAWAGSHSEIGYAHIGTCRNEIHKCPCK